MAKSIVLEVWKKMDEEGFQWTRATVERVLEKHGVQVGNLLFNSKNPLSKKTIAKRLNLSLALVSDGIRNLSSFKILCLKAKVNGKRTIVSLKINRKYPKK